MTAADTIAMAVQALRLNALRSLLTSLGIIIGVGAVITTVAVGRGAEAQLQQLITNLGANLLDIRPGRVSASGRRMGGGSERPLTDSMVEAIAGGVPGIAAVGGYVRGNVNVVRGNRNIATELRGGTPGYLAARDWEVVLGRLPDARDEARKAKVALLGTTVHQALFGAEDPVGQEVRIGAVPFVVIGVLREKGQTPWGSDQDDIVMVPLSTARSRIVGSPRGQADTVQAISVQAAAPDLVPHVKAEIEALLRHLRRIPLDQPDNFVVRDVAQIFDTQAESERTTGMLLAAVAFISLLVGGIGIMNIMLVSVTERTREIGLRMAVGARRRDILAQFLTEALILCMAGGAAGLAAGIAASMTIGVAAQWPIVIEPGVLLVAVGFSAVVGLFFGYYPASKAARLDPLTALRHE